MAYQGLSSSSILFSNQARWSGSGMGSEWSEAARTTGSFDSRKTPIRSEREMGRSDGSRKTYVRSALATRAAPRGSSNLDSLEHMSA